MNLAAQDIRHNGGRFALTATGIGLLLMIVLGMGGIYAGMVHEATLLIDRLDAELWVVQRSTRGPFAEISRLPGVLETRLEAVPGVESARRFVYHTVQRERGGKPWRFSVQGLDWPEDRGQALPLVAGRGIEQSHFELIADGTLGVALGEQIRLGKDTYTVVGITQGMTSSAGDPLTFFTLPDAQAVQFDLPGEAVRLERAARRARAENSDVTQQQPGLLDRVAGPAGGLPALAPPTVSAILVSLAPGADPQSVRQAIAGWPDVSVYTAAEQRELLLRGSVDRARRQIGLFRAILVLVSAIIMALIIYTLTLDKAHDIAMLKLIGARNRVIVGMILQQALLLGALGYAVAWVIGRQVFPLFPRLVLITPPDLALLALIVLAISVAASGLGIWKALRIQPNTLLS